AMTASNDFTRRTASVSASASRQSVSASATASAMACSGLPQPVSASEAGPRSSASRTLLLDIVMVSRPSARRTRVQESRALAGEALLSIDRSKIRRIRSAHDDGSEQQLDELGLASGLRFLEDF